MFMSTSNVHKKKKNENLKVDYKASGTKETLVTTLARVSTHVNVLDKEAIRKDWEEMQGAQQKEEDDGTAQIKASFVTDITFGDVPAQDADVSEQERAEAISKM